MANLFTFTGTSPALIQLAGGMTKTVQVQGIGHGPLHYIVPLDVYQQIQISRQYTVEELDTIVQHRRIYDIPVTIIDNGNLAENVRVGNIGRLERRSIIYPMPKYEVYDVAYDPNKGAPVYLRKFNQVKQYIKPKYDSQEEVDAAYAEVKRMLIEPPTLMDKAYNSLPREDKQGLQGMLVDIPKPAQPTAQPAPISGDDDDIYTGGRKRTRRRARKRKTRK